MSSEAQAHGCVRCRAVLREAGGGAAAAHLVSVSEAGDDVLEAALVVLQRVLPRLHVVDGTALHIELQLHLCNLHLQRLRLLPCTAARCPGFKRQPSPIGSLFFCQAGPARPSRRHGTSGH